MKYRRFKEAEVLKQVLSKLKSLELTGSVVWHSRINSGKVKTGMYYLNLCAAGTPDIIAIVRAIDGKVAVLFLECKRSGVKKLRFEQQRFFNYMADHPGVKCAVINDVSQVWSAVQKARNYE